MIGTRAFIALGSNVDGAMRQIERALAALDVDGLALAAVARCVRGPYVPAAKGGAVGAPVLNTVAEVRTWLAPDVLLDRLLAIEAEAGRVRDGGTTRILDLDLLAHGNTTMRADDLTVPHPRFTERAFVLAPWEEISPGFVVSASGATATILQHSATLRRAAPERFAALRIERTPSFPNRAGACEVLEDRHVLRAWRAGQSGSVGVVPTMGALHDGHASLIQRAAAECDAVVATLFVNPLQFGPDEDLARYPRTFVEDCAVLSRHGADAVYAPAPEDLFPPGFSTYVEPGSVAQGYEGAERPEHFRGVATVVVKLWQRTRPDRGYFGRKDAQQLAVLRQAFSDLDLGGRLLACPIVRDRDGLAQSSRNRFLGPEEHAQATALSGALDVLCSEAAAGEHDCARLTLRARASLEALGLDVDYLDVVDASLMRPISRLTGPALAIVAARVGSVRLLDNRWIAPALEASVPRAAGAE